MASFGDRRVFLRHISCPSACARPPWSRRPRAVARSLRCWPSQVPALRTPSAISAGGRPGTPAASPHRRTATKETARARPCGAVPSNAQSHSSRQHADGGTTAAGRTPTDTRDVTERDAPVANTSQKLAAHGRSDGGGRRAHGGEQGRDPWLWWHQEAPEKPPLLCF